MSPIRFAATIVLLALYLGGGKLCLRLPSPWRTRLFALLNVGTVAALCFLDMRLHPRLFTFYFGVVLAQYAVMRQFGADPGRRAWLAFFLPIAFLVAVKLLPWLSPWPSLAGVAPNMVGLYFIGVSYMAFRLSHLVVEVRNGVVPCPDLATYLSYAFFVPTIAVGPISPYSLFRESLERPDPSATPVGRSLLRIVVGMAKYLFLAYLINRLTYRGLILDGHPHAPIDLVIAAVAYYLYLYCNFSGFCDLAIGAAGLLGLRVAENFDNPLAARNVKEFWNRWHITLSTYMRDVLFTPISKAGARALGPRYAHHAIAFAIVVVFLLVGLWHGIGWGFFIFGALHAAGVAANHYYGILLKDVLGKKRLRAYLDNRVAHAVAVVATQAYVAATFFFFANDVAAMRQIAAALLFRNSLYDPVF